jgi:hypothetical protein
VVRPIGHGVRRLGFRLGLENGRVRRFDGLGLGPHGRMGRLRPRLGPMGPVEKPRIVGVRAATWRLEPADPGVGLVIPEVGRPAQRWGLRSREPGPSCRGAGVTNQGPGPTGPRRGRNRPRRRSATGPTAATVKDSAFPAKNRGLLTLCAGQGIFAGDCGSAHGGAYRTSTLRRRAGSQRG